MFIANDRIGKNFGKRRDKEFSVKWRTVAPKILDQARLEEKNKVVGKALSQANDYEGTLLVSLFYIL